MAKPNSVEVGRSRGNGLVVTTLPTGGIRVAGWALATADGTRYPCVVEGTNWYVEVILVRAATSIRVEITLYEPPYFGSWNTIYDVTDTVSSEVADDWVFLGFHVVPTNNATPFRIYRQNGSAGTLAKVFDDTLTNSEMKATGGAAPGNPSQFSIGYPYTDAPADNTGNVHAIDWRCFADANEATVEAIAAKWADLDADTSAYWHYKLQWPDVGDSSGNDRPATNVDSGNGNTLYEGPAGPVDAGGGTTYEENLQETVTDAGAVGAAGTAVGNLAETEGVGEALGTGGSGGEGLAETESVGEGLAAAVSKPAVLEESIVEDGGIAAERIQNVALEETVTDGGELGAVEAAVVAPADTVTVGSAINSGSRWPLAVSANGRHFVDQLGAPFWLHGDTAWSAVGQLTNAEIDAYLADRAARGFNAVLINAPEYAFCANHPNNIDGAAPFTGTAFQSTLGSAYWARVDHLVAEAESLGMLVVIAPTYLGYNTLEGWQSAIGNASTAQMQTYGGYVGGRYASAGNILWCLGGDTTPTNWMDKLEAFMVGLRAAGAQQLVTAHNSRDTMGIDDWAGSDVELTVNNIYTGSTPVYTPAAEARAVSPAMPFFLIEGYYENENSSTAQSLRAQAWWALCGGACGHIFGNNPMWPFGYYATTPGTPAIDADWADYLNSAGAQSMEVFADEVLTRAWHLLAPSSGILTGGVSSGADKATGAVASDGTLALCYLPSQREITVDCTLLAAGGATAVGTWLNPGTGATSSAGSHSTAGSATITPPSSGDWVLILETAQLIEQGVSETVTADEGLGVVVAGAAGLAGSEELSEEAAQAGSAVADVEETGTFGESNVPTMTGTVPLSDVLTALESATAAGQSVVAAAEQLDLSEEATVALILAATLTEAVAKGESLDAVVAALGAMVESIGEAGDVSTGGTTIYEIGLEESEGLSEETLAGLQYLAGVSESGAIDEALGRAVTFAPGLAEQYDLTEEQAQQVASTLALAESVAKAEGLTGGLLYAANVAEQCNELEEAAAAARADASLTDNQVVQDALAAFASASAELTDALSEVGDVAGGRFVEILLDDALGIAAATLAAQQAMVGFAEAMATVETLAVVGGAPPDVINHSVRAVVCAEAVGMATVAPESIAVVVVEPCA